MLNNRSNSKGKYFSLYEEIGVVLKKILVAEHAKKLQYSFELPSKTLVKGTIFSDTPAYDTGITGLVSAEDERWIKEDAESLLITASIFTESDSRDIFVKVIFNALTADDVVIEDVQEGYNGVRIESSNGSKQFERDLFAYNGCMGNKFSLDNSFLASANDCLPINTVMMFGKIQDTYTCMARCSDKKWLGFLSSNLNKKVKSIGYLVNPNVKKGEKISIFSADEVASSEEVEIVVDNEQLATILNMEKHVLVSEGGDKIPVVIAQSGLFVDGKAVDFNDYLKLIQAIAIIDHKLNSVSSQRLNYAELADYIEDGKFCYKVHLDKTGHWRVSSKVIEFWEEYCYANQRESLIMDSFESTQKSISIRGEKRRGVICEEVGSTQCCAISLATLLSSESGDPSFYDILSIIPQLVNQKVVVIDADGDLNDGPLIGGGNFSNVTLEVNGKCITGVDRAEIAKTNLQPGIIYLVNFVRPTTGKNHYILCYLNDSGKLICHFDPWRNGSYYVRGQDISFILDMQSSHFYSFLKNKE